MFCTELDMRGRCVPRNELDATSHTLPLLQFDVPAAIRMHCPKNHVCTPFEGVMRGKFL